MSLINEALRRADADKGPRPRRAAPPPPAPAQAPPRAAATQPQRWSALHVALLGGALLLAVGAGFCLWNMMGGSPAQVAAAAASGPAAASVAQATRPTAAPAVSALAQAAAAAEARKRTAAQPPRPEPAPASPKRPAPDSPAPLSKDLLAAQPTRFIDAADPQPAGREPGSEKVSGTLSRRVPDNVSEPVPAAPVSRAPAVGAAAAALAPEEPKSEAPPSPPPAERKPAARPSPPPPLAAPAEDELAKFTVSSVVVSGKMATAIINGRVVGVGDTIDGAKILAITRHSIDLEINGHQATLRM